MFRYVLVLIVSLTSFSVGAQVDWKKAYEDAIQASKEYQKRTEARLKKYKESEKVLIAENRALKSKIRTTETFLRRLTDLNSGAIMATRQVEKAVENHPKLGPGEQNFLHNPLWLVTSYFDYDKESSLMKNIGMDIQVSPNIFHEHFSGLERGDIIIVPCSITYKFFPPPKNTVKTVRLTGVTGVGRYEFSIKYDVEEGKPMSIKMGKR